MSIPLLRPHHNPNNVHQNCIHVLISTDCPITYWCTAVSTITIMIRPVIPALCTLSLITAQLDTTTVQRQDKMPACQVGQWMLEGTKSKLVTWI